MSSNTGYIHARPREGVERLFGGIYMYTTCVCIFLALFEQKVATHSAQGYIFALERRLLRSLCERKRDAGRWN